MRKFLLLSAAACLALAPAGRAPAAEDDASRAVIEKAVKALGGADKVAKLNAFKVKSKGTMEVMGLTLEFTNEGIAQAPDQLRSTMDLEVMGQKVGVVQVFNKDKGWIKVDAGGNEMTTEIKDDLLDAMKQAGYAQYVENLLPLLKDKAFTLSNLGEVKVNDKPAVGVKVASKGKKDINLYFDKDTGLLVKRDGMGVDQNLKEVMQEVYYSDYKELDGLKRPTKVVVHQDGKKFMEAEVLEMKFVDKFDDSEFGKP